MERSFSSPWIVCGVLIALVALCPVSMAENVQGTHEETVYLTEAARQILGDDLDESLYGAEEGVLDMRYVILPADGEDSIVGVRLRYPAPVELSALSVDTYEVADYPYCGLFVNDDGMWGHAETAGRFVFLLFQGGIPLRELEAAYAEQEAGMEAQWGAAPGCGVQIAIWQTKTIWLSNGNYVPRHMFFAAEGVRPEEEEITQKNSMISGCGCRCEYRRNWGRMCGRWYREGRREWERIRGP